MRSKLRIRDRLDHRFAETNLSAYLDDELPDAQKRRLERHLGLCATCRQELASLRHTVALLRQAPLRPVPRSFILPISAQPEQARSRRWNLTYAYLRGATVVACFLFVLLISSDALIGMGAIPIPESAPPSEKRVVQEALPPATVCVEAVIEREVPVQAPPTEGAPPPTEAPTALPPAKAFEEQIYPMIEPTSAPEDAALSVGGGERQPSVGPVPPATPGILQPEDTQKVAAI